MNVSRARKIVTMAMLFTIIIGVVNSLVKRKQWPSRTFVIGSGVAWLGIAGLAEVEPELATPLSLAILTTALLGEGDGVLSIIAPKGELNTKKGTDKTKPQPAAPAPTSPPADRGFVTPGVAMPGGITIPGIAPTAGPPTPVAIGTNGVPIFGTLINP